MSGERKLLWLPLLVGLVAVAGCAELGSGTEPDDMSVEGHRRHAGEHVAKASEHEDRYDPDVQVEPYPGRPSGSERRGADYDYRYTGDFFWGRSTYNPTARHLAHADTHEAHSQQHLAAARVLEQFEEAQCVSFPPSTRASCPLIGQLVSVEDVDGGSRVRFAEGVDVNASVAHIRCHLAFARSRARAGMDACPLYLEGVRVSRVGSGPEVDFLIEPGGDLDALRERMRLHVAPHGH